MFKTFASAMLAAVSTAATVTYLDADISSLRGVMTYDITALKVELTSTMQNFAKNDQ